MNTAAGSVVLSWQRAPLAPVELENDEPERARHGSIQPVVRWIGPFATRSFFDAVAG
ncbi:hypothetical protein [Dokdonella sp.]|uniref:hypothetical protein n=1 Tax=Dokdonella sp. TaxID=2291710 RepID=UPI003527497F